MTRRTWLLLSVAAAAGGCWPRQDPLPTVPDNPFVAASPEALRAVANAPATAAVERRVNEVGQRLLAANAGLPVRPTFAAVGSPEPEVFHHDASVIFVSEGLANRCGSDAQLAAVLGVELGKMVSQREAQLALRARRPDREPPPSVSVGGDTRGAFGAADATHLAELGKFEERNPGGPAGKPPLPPDPQLLARTYLTRAGYTPADLEAAQPLLREADKHSELEKQLNGGPICAFVP